MKINLRELVYVQVALAVVAVLILAAHELVEWAGWTASEIHNILDFALLLVLVFAPILIVVWGTVSLLRRMTSRQNGSAVEAIIGVAEERCMKGEISKPEFEELKRSLGV